MIDSAAVDYDPNTPSEIARGDALDEIDLDDGRDFDGPTPPCDRQTDEPPGAGKIAEMARRYELRIGLFNPAEDAQLGDDRPGQEDAAAPSRDRRPSELSRRPSFRELDAARKRAARRRRRKDADAA